MLLKILNMIPPWVFITLVVHFTILGTVAYLILLERKVASWTQDRLGPNRVGPWGLLQPIADGIKFILKEDYAAKNIDKILFTLAPAIMIIVIIMSIAVLPWGGTKQTTERLHIDAAGDIKVNAIRMLHAGVVIKDDIKVIETVNPGTTVDGDAIPAQVVADVTYQYPFQIANLNIGVLFILGILSLAVYGVVIGGWASNNKYSFLGGLRATAQMISYEIPLGLAVLVIVVMFGTLDLNEIVDKQAHYWAGFIPAWNVFTQPLAFIMFLICIHAESNRAPFDLAECEQELVGGYHTEYSAMRFALFFLAEYAEMITTSVVCVALFFGGWHLPGLSGPDLNNPSVTSSLNLCILRALVVFGKSICIVFIFMWTRWSLPRFRFDQLMQLAWRAMIPLSLAMVFVAAITLFIFGRDNAFYHATQKIDARPRPRLLRQQRHPLRWRHFRSQNPPRSPRHQPKNQSPRKPLPPNPNSTRISPQRSILPPAAYCLLRKNP